METIKVGREGLHNMHMTEAHGDDDYYENDSNVSNADFDELLDDMEDSSRMDNLVMNSELNVVTGEASSAKLSSLEVSKSAEYCVDKFDVG